MGERYDIRCNGLAERVEETYQPRAESREPRAESREPRAESPEPKATAKAKAQKVGQRLKTRQASGLSVSEAGMRGLER